MNRLIRSMAFSLAGLKEVVAAEPNMKLHLLAAFCVMLAGIGLRISPLEWALVIGCIGMVLALECVNTAIERLADRVSQDQDPLVKQAKDTAACAVMIASLAAAVIGAIVFLPKFLELWTNGSQ